MTLVAAWLTPDNKIIASDSRMLDTDGNIIDEKCKKIFSTDSFAIGLFGGFGLAFNMFKKQKLLTDKMQNENWNKATFFEELNKYLKNINPEKSEKKLKSNLLFVPINEESFIVRINPKNEIEELSLQKYKDLYQLNELGDVLFSDQELNDGTTDFIHQKELFKHFSALKENHWNKIPEIVDVPHEVCLFIEFFRNVLNPDHELINRKSIGGNKIFYAYSFGHEAWLQKEHILAETKQYEDTNKALINLTNLLKSKGKNQN